MKLFTKVINCLKAATHKLHKENASTFEIEILSICLLVFYNYLGVALIKKKVHTKKAATLRK